jgi:acyl-CoA oxidase
VKGLQTRATYHPPPAGAASDVDGEFEVHTPTVEATKWWIGGAGETSTHAAVYARCIAGGVDHGVHTFMVQVRAR